MHTDRLNELIQRKNVQLEREAIDTAETHIEKIINLRAHIERAEKEIAEHQSALKALQVPQVSASEILGQ